jgi:hypothetical protein
MGEIGLTKTLDLPFHLLVSRLFSAIAREDERKHVAVNLQLLSAVNRFKGGFSSNQWLCCSPFAPIAHSWPENLLTFQVIYQLDHTLFARTLC